MVRGGLRIREENKSHFVWMFLVNNRRVGVMGIPPLLDCSLGWKGEEKITYQVDLQSRKINDEYFFRDC